MSFDRLVALASEKRGAVTIPREGHPPFMAMMGWPILGMPPPTRATGSM